MLENIPLEIDIESRTVTVAGKRRGLRGSRLRILAALWRVAPGVLDYGDIRLILWGCDAKLWRKSDKMQVRVLMSGLRGVLADLPVDIQYVRNHGYMMIPRQETCEDAAAC